MYLIIDKGLGRLKMSTNCLKDTILEHCHTSVDFLLLSFIEPTNSFSSTYHNLSYVSICCLIVCCSQLSISSIRMEMLSV